MLLVLMHMKDHIGGMDDIINNFDIGTFYMPDVITTTKTFEDVLVALDNKNIYFDVPGNWRVIFIRRINY